MFNAETGSRKKLKKDKKPKKPIYKRWWFYVIAAIVLFAVIGKVAGGEKTEKIKWSEMVLGEQLPEPPATKGVINENSSDGLSVEIKKVTDKQYADYLAACREKGFTVDEKTTSSTFEAYNGEGYKLSLYHYGAKDGLSIRLEKPMEMSEITWPASAAGSRLPAPKSAIGKFAQEYDDNFFVYVGNMSKTDYNDYVKACSDYGFSVNYNKGDDYYYADNADGWHISLKYMGNNIMSIDIDPPKEKAPESTTAGETAKPSETEAETEAHTEVSSVRETTSVQPKGGSNYETIYNEYAQKIRDAAPTSSVSELAEITNEGVGKMAEYMYSAKGTDGQYATYEEWAGKLMDVYLSEAR